MSLPTLQIQPHQLSPLLATPRSLALLFAGAATYVGFVDPCVRDSMKKTRLMLRHWATMYKISIKIMGSLALAGAAFAGLCYWKTQQNLWAVGAAIMASAWPYTLLVLMPTNNYLMQLDSKISLDAELTSGDNYTVLDKLKFWVKGHKGRILISLLAAGVFYLAQLKSTENVNVSVALK